MDIVDRMKLIDRYMRDPVIESYRRQIDALSMYLTTKWIATGLKESMETGKPFWTCVSIEPYVDNNDPIQQQINLIQAQIDRYVDKHYRKNLE